MGECCHRPTLATSLWQQLENQGGKKDEHLWQQLEEIHKMYQEGFYVAATDILQEFNPLGTDGRS